MILRCLYKRSLVSSCARPWMYFAAQNTSTATRSAPTAATAPLTENEKLITQLYENIPKTGPRYIRNLRFKKFVEKMERIYLLEREWQRNAEKRDKDFMIHTISSKAPIHETFSYYNANNKAGFSGRNIAGCLKGISDILRVRGPIPVHYHDYSAKEVLSSWPMYHFLEDIDHGFKISTLLLPHDMANV